MEKKFNIIFVLFMLLTFNTIVSSVSASNLTVALDWLKNNQNADGHFGPDAYNEHWTAYAALALYLNESNSTNTTNALSWLKPRLEDSSYWFWTITGEVDIPALILYTFNSTSHLSDISGNLTNITSNLLYYQKNFYVTNAYTPNQNFTVLNNTGGFSGWTTNFSLDYSNFSRVEDSVDTSFALLGLISSDYIPESNKTAAINYLLSLQNPDGSFNLTSDLNSSELYSLGPDLGSTTALSLFALNATGFNSSNNSVTNGLNYLKNSSITCFGNKSYSYTTAILAWAFSVFDETNYANSLINYLMILQNSDGGFSDSRRFTYPASQALDTAIATIAMEKFNVIDNPFNANITVNPTIGLGDTQEISVNTSGSILCTHNNYLAANITFPNGTVKQIILVFNPSSNNYENSFSETNMNGTYNVTAVVDPIFYDNITLNSSFEAKTKDGDSCSQNSECLNGYCVHSKCRSSSTYCGDGYCDSGESCSSCSNDCGTCPAPSAEPSGGGGYTTTTTTSSTTTSTTTTVPTTTTTTVTTTTVPTTTTTTQPSSAFTGMFLLISTYKWHLVFLTAIIALAIFFLWKEDIIL